MAAPLSSVFSPFACHTCGRQQENIQRCSQCKVVFYCSTECQKKDWSRHKLVCRKSEAKEEDQKIASAAQSANVVPQKGATTATERMERYLEQEQSKWEAFPKSKREDSQSKYWPIFARRHQNDPTYICGFPIHKNSLAMDLGAGPGNTTRQLLQQGFRVIAVDYFKGFKEFMNSTIGVHRKLEVIEEDLAHFARILPQNQTAFLIVALDVICYLPPKIALPLMRACYQSLEKGGVFAVGFDAVLSKMSPKQAEIVKGSGGWAVPSAEEVCKALEEMGFEVVRQIHHHQQPRIAFICIKK